MSVSDPRRLLAVSGSLRAKSINTAVLSALLALPTVRTQLETALRALTQAGL